MSRMSRKIVPAQEAMDPIDAISASEEAAGCRMQSAQQVLSLRPQVKLVEAELERQ